MVGEAHTADFHQIWILLRSVTIQVVAYRTFHRSLTNRPLVLYFSVPFRRAPSAYADVYHNVHQFSPN